MCMSEHMLGRTDWSVFGQSNTKADTKRQQYFNCSNCVAWGGIGADYQPLYMVGAATASRLTQDGLCTLTILTAFIMTL